MVTKKTKYLKYLNINGRKELNGKFTFKKLNTKNHTL